MWTNARTQLEEKDKHTYTLDDGADKFPGGRRLVESFERCLPRAQVVNSKKYHSVVAARTTFFHLSQQCIFARARSFSHFHMPPKLAASPRLALPRRKQISEGRPMSLSKVFPKYCAGIEFQRNINKSSNGLRRRASWYMWASAHFSSSASFLIE